MEASPPRLLRFWKSAEVSWVGLGSSPSWPPKDAEGSPAALSKLPPPPKVLPLPKLLPPKSKSCEGSKVESGRSDGSVGLNTPLSKAPLLVRPALKAEESGWLRILTRSSKDPLVLRRSESCWCQGFSAPFTSRPPGGEGGEGAGEGKDGAEDAGSGLPSTSALVDGGGRRRALNPPFGGCSNVGSSTGTGLLRFASPSKSRKPGS